MAIASALKRSRAALAHWGPVEYLLLAALWLAFSIPLLLAGWGAASLLSLPLLLLAIVLLTTLAKSMIKPSKVHPVQPRAGFPGELVHPELGVFPLSTYSGERYEKTISWCGTPTRLSLSLETIESIEAVLNAATATAQAGLNVNSQVQAFATNELLQGINEERKASGASALDAKAFLHAISLEMITVHADNTYEFLYNDGQLLGGHWIEVHGNLEDGPIDIDAPG